MDSSVLPKDEIRFLRVYHHISTGLYARCDQRIGLDSGGWQWFVCSYRGHGFSRVYTALCSSCTRIFFLKANLSECKPSTDNFTAVEANCVGINEPCDGSDDNSEYFNREIWCADWFICGRKNPVWMSVMSRLFAIFSNTLTLETNSDLESKRDRCQLYSEHLPVRYRSMLYDVMCWHLHPEPDTRHAMYCL